MAVLHITMTFDLDPWPWQRTWRRHARAKNIQIIWCKVDNEQKL